LKGDTVTKTAEELQSEYEDLKQRRERLLPEITRISIDLAKTRGVVLSEVDAFARAQALSSRLSELTKERDALTEQIERGKVSPR
jgi:predicted  nucleic acid-binding Zn-ribbon protein